MCAIPISPRHRRGVKSAQSNTKQSADRRPSPPDSGSERRREQGGQRVLCDRGGRTGNYTHPKTRRSPPRCASRLLSQPRADACLPRTHGRRDRRRPPAPSRSRASLRFRLCRTGSPHFVSARPPVDQGLIATLSDGWNQEAGMCEKTLRVEES